MIVGGIEFYVNAWEPNRQYNDLKAKIDSGKATSTEKTTWARVQDNLNVYYSVPGHPGLYWTDDSTYHSRAPYSGYFTSRRVYLTEDQYSQVCQGTNWRNLKPGQSFWDSDDENGDEDGHENDRYSLRFGMLPESSYTDITIALFKKYKEGGWLSEESWGHLSIVGVDAMPGDSEKYTTSGGYLSYMKINDTARTETVTLSTKGEMGRDSVQIIDSAGNPISNPGGLMIHYKHADQNTKHYGHDSHAVIFPFGK